MDPPNVYRETCEALIPSSESAKHPLHAIRHLPPDRIPTISSLHAQLKKIRSHIVDTQASVSVEERRRARVNRYFKVLKCDIVKMIDDLVFAPIVATHDALLAGMTQKLDNLKRLYGAVAKKIRDEIAVSDTMVVMSAAQCEEFGAALFKANAVACELQERAASIGFGRHIRMSLGKMRDSLTTILQAHASDFKMNLFRSDSDVAISEFTQSDLVVLIPRFKLVRNIPRPMYLQKVRDDCDEEDHDQPTEYIVCVSNELYIFHDSNFFTMSLLASAPYPFKKKWRNCRDAFAVKYDAGNGCIYCVGGYNKIPEGRLCDKYVIDKDTWYRLPSLNECKYNCSCTIVGRLLYCMGCYYMDELSYPDGIEDIKSEPAVERLDMMDEENGWESLGHLVHMPGFRCFSMLQVAPEQCLLIMRDASGNCKEMHWDIERQVIEEGELIESCQRGVNYQDGLVYEGKLYFSPYSRKLQWTYDLKHKRFALTRSSWK